MAAGSVGLPGEGAALEVGAASAIEDEQSGISWGTLGCFTLGSCSAWRGIWSARGVDWSLPPSGRGDARGGDGVDLGDPPVRMGGLLGDSSGRESDGKDGQW